MAPSPTFEFTIDGEVDDRLLVGTASPGMASLVAVDHLVSVTDAEPVGHATAHDLATMTPFSDGVPRRPTRVYDIEGGPSTVVSELFLPMAVGDRFAEALVELAKTHDVDEVTVLYGVPYPHGPNEHAVFSVATEDFPAKALESAGVEPLKGGFLDGIPGTLLEGGLADEDIAVGVLVTPAHPPGPDFEGALRLLDAIEEHSGTTVDTTLLEQRSEEVQQYYAELASRIEAAESERDSLGDRMFM